LRENGSHHLHPQSGLHSSQAGSLHHHGESAPHGCNQSSLHRNSPCACDHLLPSACEGSHERLLLQLVS
jgi:hypothetical protein